MRSELKKLLLNRACAPYRATGAFNYHWARGKLSHDPVFSALIEKSALPDDARVLDLGCGRGLLAAWLLAAEQLAQQGDWDEGPAPPSVVRLQGVDLAIRQIECGKRALQPLYGARVQFFVADMRHLDLDSWNVVAILDALHYIPLTEQEQLLRRIRGTLPPEGLLILRVGDADAGLRATFSKRLDQVVSFVQSHHLPTICCRSLSELVGMLRTLDFRVETFAMSAGTPFANTLLICRLPQ